MPIQNPSEPEAYAMPRLEDLMPCWLDGPTLYAKDGWCVLSVLGLEQHVSPGKSLHFDHWHVTQDDYDRLLKSAQHPSSERDKSLEVDSAE